jgi:hypothetical protein
LRCIDPEATVIGPWHLHGPFDAAIDRRRRYYRRRRWPAPAGRSVTVWQSRVQTGPAAVWPPIARDDQAEYARRLVQARVDAAALITVLHRRGRSAVLIVDVFGGGLSNHEQRRVRSLLEGLAPRPFFRIRPWVAIGVGPYGAFSTNVRVWDDGDCPGWGDMEVLGPAVDALAEVLAAPDEAARRAA